MPVPSDPTARWQRFTILAVLALGAGLILSVVAFAQESGHRGAAPATDFPVGFSESGLPVGTMWSVTVNGSLETALTNSLVVELGNGTYQYDVTPIPGYITPHHGTLVVVGAPVGVPIAFAQFEVAVVFSESGLPTGTNWTVTLNATPEATESGAIAYSEPNGTYGFSVSQPSAYVAIPHSGTVTVNGAPVRQTVAYEPLTTLTETGSGVLYPVVGSWSRNYSAMYPNVTVIPSSTGNSLGVSQAEEGLVNIGASDGYLANASATSVLDLPVAISSQLLWYNLPGVTGHLNLNGTTVAKIYSGNITTWDDPEILAAQSPEQRLEIAALSSTPIHPLIRQDASEDTFLFTSYCDMSWSGWPFGAGVASLSGDRAPGEAFETGNPEMVTAMEDQIGAIAYIQVGYSADVTGVGLNYAALGDNNSLSAIGGINPANYVLWSPANVTADATLGLTHLDLAMNGLAISLVLGGNSLGPITFSTGGGGTTPAANTTPYPIVNLEYTLVKTAPTGSVVTGPALAATVHFLEWAITEGNGSSYLNPLGLVAVTTALADDDDVALGSVVT